MSLTYLIFGRLSTVPSPYRGVLTHRPTASDSKEARIRSTIWDAALTQSPLESEHKSSQLSLPMRCQVIPITYSRSRSRKVM